MTEQLAAHIRVVSAIEEHLPLLGSMADLIVERIRAGGRLYVLGNGGSAADAQHIAAELVGRFKLDREGLPATALTTDTSALTAITNDYGQDSMFSRQVDALVRQEDVVWALSVSGTSSNVIQAMESAKRIGATLIGFTGRRGDVLAHLCEFCFRAAHEDSDRVQEAHGLAYHLICDRIERAFCS
jgi:D-sedoheptulose 7-phosphate isomerase